MATINVNIRSDGRGNLIKAVEETRIVKAVYIGTPTKVKDHVGDVWLARLYGPGRYIALG